MRKFLQTQNVGASPVAQYALLQLKSSPYICGFHSASKVLVCV